MCIATVDRPEAVAEAVRSVLHQRGAVPEVVVVHQGEAASAAELERSLAALDGGERVRVVHQERLGLSMSRNRGLAEARTEWVAFLDDDDRLLPQWSSLLAPLLDERTGLASCSAELVTAAGEVLGVERADQPVALVGDGVLGSQLAGCWVARRSLLEQVGGYLSGIACSHQTELWMRLVPAVAEAGLEVRHVAEVGVRVERRGPDDRTMASPKVQFDGGRWLLARHDRHLAADRSRRADVLGMLGVSAARLGRWPDARRYAVGALRAQPTDPRRWARLALAAVPAAGRRAWGTAPDEPSTLPVVPKVAADLDPDDERTAALDALLFLPHGYRTNPARSADAEGTPFWTPEAPTGGNDVRFQDQVYRWAARLVRSGEVGSTVVDIGCGSGHKLVRHVAPVTDRWLGVDQPSGIATATATFPDGRWLAVDLATDDAWAELDAQHPDLVLCADVIEHLTDPHLLLARLRALAGPDGRVLLSTPDRARLDDASPLGPPRNPRHIREWSRDEMELLLESTGFEVVAQRHLLPRRYSPTVLEAKRTVHRALHGRAVPDRRSCMAFLLRPAR